jgi:myo-inositol-1(or 4)-monophosphatase
MSEHLEAAVAIAREAGALVMDISRQRGQLAIKSFDLKGDFDLVTEADRASEKLIVERIHQRFPNHSIVAEEGGGGERASEYRWYVDPVDGTTNFAHGFPVFNVTLALEKAGEVIAGVVYDPTRDEMFAAERGGGAYLNQQPIAVSRVATVETSLVATGFPSRKRHENVNVHFFYQLAMLSHGVRRAGAAAIDLAYVACGRLDAFWEFALNPWDMAAGLLLIREAGGHATTMIGEPHHLRSPHLLATNGHLHPAMTDLFGEIFAGRAQYRLPEIGPAA